LYNLQLIPYYKISKIIDEITFYFDPERLKIPKKFDPFDLIEFCLNLEIDPQRLTRDYSILGGTAFNDGLLEIWPENSENPKIHPVKKGTILIDDRLLSPDANIGRRNFTLLHEAAHWILHSSFFAQNNLDYILCYGLKKTGVRDENLLNNLKIIQTLERQANMAAANFLMPTNAVKFAVRKIMGITYSYKIPIERNFGIDNQIREIADMFDASYQAMTYRLINLGYVKNNYPDFC
jgi:hypothetical protein